MVNRRSGHIFARHLSAFLSVFDDSGRCADCDSFIGDFRFNDRSGAYHSPVPDPGTVKDDNPYTQPRIIANNNATLCAYGLTLYQFSRLESMVVGIKGAIRRNLNPAADLNRALVGRKLTSRLDVSVFTDGQTSTLSGFNNAIPVYVCPFADPDRAPSPCFMDRHAVSYKNVSFQLKVTVKN